VIPSKRLLCPHTNTTDEDGDGRAICVTCGTVVIVRLTQALLLDQVQHLWKRAE
jgi:hypothetical protein